MATAPNVVKLKRSSVAGKIPQTTDLNLGELALNTYDGRIYLKKSVESVETVVALQPFPDGGITGQVLSLDSSGNLTWSTASGTGTVTSITAGTGLTGGTITGVGTLAVDTSVIATHDYVTTAIANATSPSVRYDINNQNLTSIQQSNARINIGLDDATLYFYCYMFG
jgi:hypothetical protein